MVWDNCKAVKSDDVVDCFSYVDIVEMVVSYVEGVCFVLVECVVEEVVELLLVCFNLLWVCIKFSKLGAVVWAVNVGVIIECGNNLKENN